MNFTNSRFLTTLCAIALPASPTFSATVIYSDAFTSGTNGALNSQAPQIRPTTETWTSNTSNWNKNTSTGLVTAGGSTSAVLAAPTFSAGDIYTVTVRLFNTTTGTGWSAFGFTTGTTGVYSNANVGMYWILWRGNGELRPAEHGANFVGSGVTVAGENNQLDARIVFDVDAYTMTWLYKNPSATEWTQVATMTPSTTRINSINNVGLSSNQNSGTGAASFELTNIPEPRAALLGGLGLLILLRRRR